MQICWRFNVLACLALLGGTIVSPTSLASAESARNAATGDRDVKTLRLAMRTSGPRTLDPASGTSTYDNRAAVQVYETLLEFDYTKRPYELRPLLLAEMPVVSEDGLTIRFKLRDDVYFHDSEVFPGGEGRRMVTDDVFYSWKRLADPAYRLQAWPKLANTIVGFDEYKDEQGARVAAGEPFDYDAPVEGLHKLSDTEFELRLKQPDQQLMWKLATFHLAVVAREAVEAYGSEINTRMVGTGPFMLEEWLPNTRVTYVRNPEYREVYFPEELSEEAIDRGFDASIGRRLPLVDRLEFEFFVEDQPRWLEFKAGNLDVVMVPDSATDEVLSSRTKRLRREWRRDGVDYQPLPLFDFIYRGFNMDNPVLGGYSPDRIALRRAIALSLDWDELNESLYSGLPVIYDGVIPPGIPGHPEGGRLTPSNRGPDFDRARALLREAGYTVVDGKVTDLDPIELWTSTGSQSEKNVELWQRSAANVGIRINPRYVNFARLTQALDNSEAPMFSLAWSSAYPDAEYNLQLFYGPNEAPGPNAFNFRNDEFDRLFEKIKVIGPGPERDAAYARMQEILTEYVPYFGSQARVRPYLVHPWVRNFLATETFYNYTKYVDVDTDHPDRPR